MTLTSQTPTPIIQSVAKMIRANNPTRTAIRPIKLSPHFQSMFSPHLFFPPMAMASAASNSIDRMMEQLQICQQTEKQKLLRP